ncbi:MAG: DUF4491 family protein [Chloroflexi bacterium]|nr:DUF4491 family protein [Chloroflexota bacterium]
MEGSGLFVGAFSVIVIAFGHFWVKKLEYHVGAQVWPGVVAVGAIFILGSLFAPHWMLSVVLGILGFTTLWGAHELVDLGERVKRGWYPHKPQTQ